MASDRLRVIAMERALYMSKLFREPYYSEIMNALYLYSTKEEAAMKQAKQNFDRACHNAKLSDKETAWLFNYLKEFDQEKADWQVRAQININW